MRGFKDKTIVFPWRIAVIGLGYVGAPLLSSFAAKFECRGLDSSLSRIKELSSGFDRYGNIASEDLARLKDVILTSCWDDISDCNCYVIAAPTPVDENNSPDLSILTAICSSLGGILKKHDTVVFESTVFPGCTEEVCIPLLEKYSGLKVNIDFEVGYSPERVNVGDRSHSLSNINKIVSATSCYALERIAELYSEILNADVVKASNIKTAEAAKIYENTQRDILIALANQFSDYCRKEGIDIFEVTECASTKWNFAKVFPGLVGGHCISVDPYYLVSRGKALKVDLPLVECARRVNENKALDVARRILDFSGSEHENKRILILGLSYKPDTSDIRNTKVADVIEVLNKYFKTVDCHDPLVDKTDAERQYGIRLVDYETCRSVHYDIVIEMVGHSCFRDKTFDCDSFLNLKILL